MSFTDPIADLLTRIRMRGADDFDNVMEVSVHGGLDRVPLRCCLRDAEPGERTGLVAVRPAAVHNPYSEVGPVFIHAEACDGYQGAGYPPAFRGRRQLFRSYDRRGRQVDNRIVDGAAPEPVLEQLFVRADISYVHSRNPLAGCYMFSITRRVGA